MSNFNTPTTAGKKDLGQGGDWKPKCHSDIFLVFLAAEEILSQGQELVQLFESRDCVAEWPQGSYSYMWNKMLTQDHMQHWGLCGSTLIFDNSVVHESVLGKYQHLYIYIYIYPAVSFFIACLPQPWSVLKSSYTLLCCHFKCSK